jgi:hypothetical protein
MLNNPYLYQMPLNVMWPNVIAPTIAPNVITPIIAPNLANVVLQEMGDGFI